MPHDSEGNLVVAGDRVMIPAVVKVVTQGERFCNLTVQLELPFPPDNIHQEISYLNTKQVTKRN